MGIVGNVGNVWQIHMRSTSFPMRRSDFCEVSILDHPLGQVEIEEVRVIGGFVVRPVGMRHELATCPDRIYRNYAISIKDLPPVRNILHSAVLLSDTLFENTTRQGAWNLHDLMPDNLDFIAGLSLLGKDKPHPKEFEFIFVQLYIVLDACMNVLLYMYETFRTVYEYEKYFCQEEEDTMEGKAIASFVDDENVIELGTVFEDEDD
ncbi:hypothetical protein F5883DRAFT_526525 [Diaporthe sp. PMI_573]|nr:hypothetical protein F5883DRAFT_526525 [Diaporthaceae sp. PMI_573]